MGLALVTLMVTGCGTTSQMDALDPDAEHFRGLDPNVVAEVIADPVVSERVNSWSTPEVRNAEAQASVLTWIVLRDALEVYVEWRDQGVSKTLAPPPVPDHPNVDVLSMVEADHALIQREIDSGDIAQLRQVFVTTFNGSADIPAYAGQPDGPTIYDVVVP